MANMTTRTIASVAERLGGTLYFWGHTGAGPASDRRIASTDIIQRDASGRVGIGISASLGRLHVFQDGTAANTDAIVISGGLSSSSFGQALSWYQNTLAVRAAYVSCNTNSGGGKCELHFGTSPSISVTNASTRMILNGDGDLYLGRSSQIGGSRASFERDGSAGAPVLSLNHTAPSGTRYFEAFYISGVEVGSIISTGSTTAYQTSSDYRLKDQIEDLTGSGELIDALRPRIGIWKADGSDFVGFIAHEFAEVFPNSVSGEKDGTEIRPVIDEVTGEETEVEVPKMQAMQASSSEVMAVIIAELQSLRARVAALEA